MTIRNIRESWRNLALANSSMIACSLVLLAAGIFTYSATGAYWISYTLLCLSVLFAIRCWLKSAGPFEVATVVITATAYILFILCVCIENVHNKIESLLDVLFLSSWDWLALAIAFVSLIFVACTWVSQERTQKNTMRISPEIQKGLLIDIFRHSYRNIMVLYAMEARLKDHLNTHYPSEEHIRKLKVNDNSIYPEAFVGEPEKCRNIENYKLILRNTNIEIDVFAEHLKNPDMHLQIKKRDLDLLKLRIEYLLKRTYELIKDLWGEKIIKDTMAIAAKYVDEKAADRKAGETEFIRLRAHAYELLDNGELQPYYAIEDSEFTKALFRQAPDESARQFVRKLNANIYAVVHTENIKDKICLIPFKPSDSII